MKRPFLLTLEYPPLPATLSLARRAGQHGGVARYLAGEVKSFDGEVVVGVILEGARRFGGRPIGSSISEMDSIASVAQRATSLQNDSIVMWRLWLKWLPLIWRARPQFKKEKCDYLWISHVLPMGYVALVWKCFYKTPYRVYLHGLDLVRPRQSAWKRFWVKMILKNADEIIVNSNATAELLKYYGIDLSRARVQYPRIEKIDIDKYKPIGEKLRQKYNISDKPILLTISRLVKRKGIDLVINSLTMVWQKIPDLVYVVVGEGEERGNLEAIKTAVIPSLSRNLVDNPRDPSTPLRSAQDDGVIFTGPVSDDEKYGWLSACNCFILTPIDDPNDFEGYGIVYKEAQMFGKSVIGSRVGGVPEAVGDDGVLVEAGNLEQISGAILQSIKK